jgi:hypothetical protein
MARRERGVRHHRRALQKAVVRQAPLPVLADAVPYVTAIIELAEGPWLPARLIDSDPADLRAGAEVEVRFVRPQAPNPAEGSGPAPASEVLPVFALSSSVRPPQNREWPK